MASRFWVLSNEDSRAKLFRSQHQANNSGSWSYNAGSGWIWTDKIEEEVKAPVKKEVKKVEAVTEEAPKKRNFFRKRDK